MAPAYRFLDRWAVQAPIDRVYDTIGDVVAYERWWNLTRVLRPLFRSNHNWSMRHGERQIREYLGVSEPDMT